MGERVYKCDDVLILLGELVLGIIDDADRGVVERHLTECPSCAAELDVLQTLYGALELLQPVRPDEGFERRVTAGVRRAVKAEQEAVATLERPKRTWWQIPGLVPGLAVAAAAVLTVIVFFAMIPLFGGLQHMTGEHGPSILTTGETSRVRDVSPGERPIPYAPEIVAEGEGVTAEEAETPAVRPPEKRERGVGLSPPTAEEYWAGGMGEREAPLKIFAGGEVATDFDAEYLKAAGTKGVFQRRLAAYWATRRTAGGSVAGPPGRVTGVNGAVPPNGWKDPKVDVDFSRIDGGDEAVAEYTTFDDGVSVYFVYEAPPATQDGVIEDLRRTDKAAPGAGDR
jgi:hypothetical protein